MFRDACKKARAFTRPLLTVFRYVDGRFVHGAASMVIVNEEGWFITAAHLFDSLTKARAEAAEIREWTKRKLAIEGDPSLDAKRKRKQISRLSYDRNWIDHVAFFWMNGVDLAKPLATHVLHVSRAHDLAIGQIAGFDRSLFPEYPVFQNPNSDVEAGASLCRMGFPFAKTSVSADPDGSIAFGVDEVTYFPNEAMVTREVGEERSGPDGEPLPRYLETSTPGLRGQSGGPVFDSKGIVWGIQSFTAHISLGFDPPDPTNTQRTVHQFLNVGVCVHPAIIQWFMKKHGVKFASGQ